jgi:hypothetical protein
MPRPKTDPEPGRVSPRFNIDEILVLITHARFVTWIDRHGRPFHWVADPETFAMDDLRKIAVEMLGAASVCQASLDAALDIDSLERKLEEHGIS